MADSNNVQYAGFCTLILCSLSLALSTLQR